MLDTPSANCWSGGIESPNARRQRVHRKVQLKNRLRLSAIRLDDGQRQRIWAIVAAYKAGLSIREIAKATGLSSSRVYQLLHDNEAQDIPDWLDDFRARELPADDLTGTSGNASPQVLLGTEIAVLRRCVGWLTATLEREQWVVEDLRPITEVGEERVLLDRPKVLRILSTIAAELDELVGRPALRSPGAAMDEVDSRYWLRKRMPRIDPPRGQRGAERKAANLAPWRR